MKVHFRATMKLTSEGRFPFEGNVSSALERSCRYDGVTAHHLSDGSMLVDGYAALALRPAPFAVTVRIVVTDLDGIEDRPVRVSRIEAELVE